jgi:hypothetical protein
VLLRHLGLHVQELEAGPYRFLLVDSVPLAYTDGTTWYRTSQYFRKGATKALNKWLRERPVQLIDQQRIGTLFQSLDKWSSEEKPDQRQGGRRKQDQVPGGILKLAEALHEVLNNGRVG